VLQVRLPTAKDGRARRFAYIEYADEESARSALYLDGQELEPGYPLSVAISNPSKKKPRTTTQYTFLSTANGLDVNVIPNYFTCPTFPTQQPNKTSWRSFSPTDVSRTSAC
jgi:hypothetical protein